MADTATPISTRLLVGALAGLTATAAMTAAMHRLHRRLPAGDRYPLPPRELTQELLAPGDETTARNATLAAHFGYGASAGALYALLTRTPRMRSGTLYAIAAWAASYLGWVPGIGALRPATAHPGSRNALMLAAHVVWGATLALTARELTAAQDSVFAKGPAKDVECRAQGTLASRVPLFSRSMKTARSD